MAQQDDRQDDETVDPKNPPNRVLRPIVVFFLVIAAALVYWRTTDRRIDPPGQRDREREYVGTTGSPDPRHGNTRDELIYRGAGDAQTAPVSELGGLFDEQPSHIIGKHVDLHDVDIAATAEPGVFWVHDGNTKIEVIAPAGTPAVRPGQRIDVSGTAESDTRGGVRIRAARVATR
jgi:hypothetical protein